MITKVTITGADDSISPSDLSALTKEFPYVEWGILVSSKSMGSPRFPSSMWLARLAEVKACLGDQMKLSCHVCGRLVKDIFMNNFMGLKAFPLDIFGRMQLNTHGEPHSFYSDTFKNLALMDQEIIFQYDNANKHFVSLAKTANVKHSALFDLSHGFGKLPSEWPDLLPNTKCGYAGGLSPENLDEQIKRIEEKAGNTEIWIDMETHVRSENDKVFDIAKVTKCLEIAGKYIN